MSAWRSFLVRQFGQPSGVPGAIAGWIMATRRSNRERNRRTIELLGIRPGDRVLEIGFGPGLALRWALEKVGSGLVVGIDPSPVMHRQAARRNAAALAAGRLEVRRGTIDDVADSRGFDHVYAVNVPVGWTSPGALERVLALLRPGGQAAFTYEPRGSGASDARALSTGERIGEALRAAGFESVEVETFPLKPVAAVCVRGLRPLPG